MKFKNCDDTEFLHTFMRILETDQSKNNTYKLALARFLLEYSHAGGNQSVKYARHRTVFPAVLLVTEMQIKAAAGSATPDAKGNLDHPRRV